MMSEHCHMKEPRKTPSSPDYNYEVPEIEVIIKEEEEGWTVSETYESFNPEAGKHDSSADACLSHFKACEKESSVPYGLKKHQGLRSDQSADSPLCNSAAGDVHPRQMSASNNVRKKRSSCLRHEGSPSYQGNMKSKQSTQDEEENHSQDQSTTSHTETEQHHDQQPASHHTDSPAGKHRLKVASANLDNQTLHLTVRLQAGEEGEEEEEEEEEEKEEEDEEIGGLINSDGEVVDWDARGSPDRSSDCTEESQQSKGVVRPESHLRCQNMRNSSSPTLIMEVEEDEEEHKEGEVKSTAVSSVYCGKKQRRKKKAPVAPVDKNMAERDVPVKPAKRRYRGKIPETPLLSGEGLDTEPGISQRTRRMTTLRTTVASEEFSPKPIGQAAAKRHYRRRKDTALLGKGKRESTGIPAGKKRPGRKMVRMPIEIPPELLKTPKEKMEYHCSVCGKQFPHAYKLERHELIHTGEKPYCCSICGRGFNQKGNLKTHYKVHLGRKGTVDFDDEVSPIASELSEYLKSLPGESRIRSSFRCLVCEEEFESQTDLQAHHITAHAQISNEVGTVKQTASEFFFCRRCGVQFKERDKLEEHMKTHIKEKPYSCPDCGKRFINESYIQIHQRIHTGEKPFLCSQCGRSFHTASSLKLHEMQHSGERPFACTICGKTFRINSYLTAHYQTHFNDRPFICSVCGKGYSRAEELKVHHRLHTGERPYKCGECDKSFIYRQGLRQHQRTHAGKRIGPTRQLGRPKQQARLDI